jgi:hypothetical protein
MNIYVHLSGPTTNNQMPTPCFLTADEREYTQMVDENCAAAQPTAAWFSTASYGVFELMGHVGMPLRPIFYFVIPRTARNDNFTRHGSI